MEAALEAQGMFLKLERDMTHGTIRLDATPGDDPCRASVWTQMFTGRWPF